MCPCFSIIAVQINRFWPRFLWKTGLTHPVFHIWADLSHPWRQRSPGPDAGVEVGAGKQHLQAVEVLLDPAIHGLSEAALHFDKAERMLHFASDRRLLAFNYLFPRLAIVGKLPVGPSRPSVDPVVDG